MPRAAQRTIPPELQQLSRRLEAHRRKRNGTRRLPDAVWTAAAALARQHGVNLVARTLRLNHATLKRRAASNKNFAAAKARPKFVEIAGGAPFWTPPCTLELEDENGRKLTIRLAELSGPEVVSLTEAFWRWAE